MRRIFVFIVALVLLSVVLGGGMALGGRAWWGDAGWYFPWNYSPEYRLRCGQEALRHSKFDRAQEVALRLEADGYQDQAALLRGESYFRKGRPVADVDQLSKALGEFQKIRDQGDIGIQAATYVGQCYLYLKQPVQAEAALRFVISRQPDNM